MRTREIKVQIEKQKNQLKTFYKYKAELPATGRKTFYTMAMENDTGIKTRAMEKCKEEGAQKHKTDNADCV